MLIKVLSSALQGIEALAVSLEIHVSRGIRYSLVGLPDNAVREGHERIHSALQVNGMDIPRKQIVVNMSPADIRKEGSRYDLPLAVGLMACGEYIPQECLDNAVFVGELSLDGSLQPVNGVLPTALMARQMGVKRLYVPYDNAREAAQVDGLDVYGVRSLRQIRRCFTGQLPPDEMRFVSQDVFEEMPVTPDDFAHIKGQESVKRALEVACSGGHNLLMIGPPGAGKTMMAKCIPGILPPLCREEAIETAQIRSVAGKSGSVAVLSAIRPFRSPHHSISCAAMAGGGNPPLPGEITLSHRGVLFLDELPEFQRGVLEVLRQPLEDRRVLISRARYSVMFPADFMLVASMNPCPCGFLGHPTRPCVCSPGQVQRYLNKISGPLLDRIDLQCEINPVSFEDIANRGQGESSASIRERVVAARNRQEERYRSYPGIHCNARMTEEMIHTYCEPSAEALRMLKEAMRKFSFSARAYTRILKVARTIADLEASENVKTHHIAEAIQYRNFDRSDWCERS